ncbi:hypothetical protein ACYULU_04200 [Breznakiellaceae bacterium SP9]
MLDSGDVQKVNYIVNELIKKWWESSPYYKAGTNGPYSPSVLVNKLNEEIEQLKTKINTPQSSRTADSSTLLKEIEQQKTQLSVQNKDIDQLKYTLNMLEQSLEAADSSILSNDIAPSSKIPDYSALSHDIEPLKKTVEGFVSELSALREEVADLKRQLSELQSPLQIPESATSLGVIKHTDNTSDERRLSALENEIEQLKRPLSIQQHSLHELGALKQTLEKFAKNTSEHENQLSLQSNSIEQVKKTLNEIRPLKQTLEDLLKKTKDNENRLSEQLSSQNNQIGQLGTQLNTQEQSLKEIGYLKTLLSDQSNEISQLKTQLGSLQQSLKTADYSASSKKAEQQNTDQIIEAFNQWAQNPEQVLPAQFSYAEGDLKLREKQTIQVSSITSALWITNKGGHTKYLFPNPNAIDQLSGKTDYLYTITGNRRARGQNKVMIDTACIIREEGWIEYKGALSLV